MKLDWKYFAMFAVTLLGVIVPVLLWQAETTSQSLTARILSSTSLQPEVKTELKNIQVSIAGVPIESPYLTVIELSNDGTKPIYSKDFESPIEVSFGKDAKAVISRVESKSPENLNVSLDVQNQAVRIQPLLLNPGDKIVFSVVTSSSLPNPNFNARIAGISKIDLKQVEDERHGWKAFLLASIVAIVSFTLATPFLNYLLKNKPIRMSRAFAVLAFFVFVSLGYISAAVVGKHFDFGMGSWETFVIYTVFSLMGAVIHGVWIDRDSSDKANAIG